MSSNKKIRKLTDDERSRLLEFSNSVNLKRKWAQGAENALVMWAVSLLLLFIFGGIGKWLIEILFAYKFQLSSETILWGISALIIGSALYAIVSSYFWIKDLGNNYAPLVKSDLKAGNAVQEVLNIVEVKGFQEQEHGGVIYFLHTHDNRTFVLHYSDSFRLPPEKRRPFVFKKELTIVIAPKSGFLLNTVFSGDVINSNKLIPLTASPEKWPETDTWSNIAWDDLENILST